ncbi:MAG: GNAT family N-acetyltransferase [Mycobacterium sp.]
MNVRLYSSPDDFGAVARLVYRRDPVLFTTELTTLRTSRWPADHLLLSVSDCEGVVGAALQMRDGILLVSGLPPTSAKDAAAALAPVRSCLPAVRGTPSTATAFSDAWAGATGATVEKSFGETLYRLDELVPPVGVIGEVRLAAVEDTELVVQWLDAFFVEAFDQPSNPVASRGVLRAIHDADGHVVLWTVNGSPVAMARVHADLLGMSRIGPVYTPPDRRGHGYGAAVTTAAVRYAHRDGARDVVLFADDANPVSNRIYRRIGFVPVAEHVQYAFSA